MLLDPNLADDKRAEAARSAINAAKTKARDAWANEHPDTGKKE